MWEDSPKATRKQARWVYTKKSQTRKKKKFHGINIRQTGGWVWIDHMAPFCLAVYGEIIFCEIPSRIRLMSNQ